jgi:hypothetical protein
MSAKYVARAFDIKAKHRAIEGTSMVRLSGGVDTYI